MLEEPSILEPSNIGNAGSEELIEEKLETDEKEVLETHEEQVQKYNRLENISAPLTLFVV